jgi:hypothetical protein
MHFALLRHYGQNVAIGDLLKGEGEVREAIWVCEASGDPELALLARQLRQPEESPAIGAVAQDTAWARDTSGFGVSRPAALDAAHGTAPSWLKPSTWMRRSSLGHG